jgi:uncharacterized protein
MLSIDTNILFYALNADSPHNEVAREFLLSVQGDERVALSELVLVELYGLLRNAAASPRPLSPAQAVDVVSSFRNHPRWRLIGFPLTSRGLHDRLWLHAAEPNFAFRRIYDARLALTLLDQGVTEFATANVRDFEGLGFKRLWNPIAPQRI